MSDDIKWWLVRGRRDPRVWPFPTEEAAREFAEDHGLIDWRAEECVDDDVPEHKAICGRCREPWPCEHERLDWEATRILSASKNRCARCGKQVGGMRIAVPAGGALGEDVVYHGRKGACRNMAKRELARLGHADLLAKVEADERWADRQNAWMRTYREAKRAGATTREAADIAQRAFGRDGTGV